MTSTLLFRTISKSDFPPGSNFLIREDENSIYFLINSRVFDKKVIIAVLFDFQRYAHTILDFDGTDYLIKLVRTTNDKTLEELAKEFNRALINFEHYFLQFEDVKEIRDQIFREVYSQLQKVTPVEEETNVNQQDFCECETPAEKNLSSELEKLEDISQKEIEEILKPWEERFKEIMNDDNK